MAITVYTYNDKVLKNVATDKWLKKPVDPYNPLNLPPNTVRVRTMWDSAPQKDGSRTTYDTATLVTGTTDVYDVYKSGTSFAGLLRNSYNVLEVLGANTTGITDMSGMFSSCSYLTTVTLFDTSSVTTMQAMFSGCSSLTTVPLFDMTNVTTTKYMLRRCEVLTTIPLFNTSNVTDMDSMCERCWGVESGALALYQQASTQTTPPSNHYATFYQCGSNTTAGTAELAQIPSDWKEEPF